MHSTGKAVALVLSGSLLATTPAAAQRVQGVVQGGSGPIVNSTVTLWAATAGAPAHLGQARTGSDGRFDIHHKTHGTDDVLYLVASGGKPGGNGSDTPGIALLAVLGTRPPARVTVNELTTVASAFTFAQFLRGGAISGKLLGLRIAAGNVPNLVDPATGGWGKVLLDPLNSTQTATLAILNTLGSLITASFTLGDASCRSRFLAAATPTGGTAPTNTALPS